MPVTESIYPPTKMFASLSSSINSTPFSSHLNSSIDSPSTSSPNTSLTFPLPIFSTHSSPTLEPTISTAFPTLPLNFSSTPSSQSTSTNDSIGHNLNKSETNIKISASLLNIRSLASKTNFVNHHIVSSNISLFALTECWLNSDSCTVPALATPDNYEFLHNPRCGRTGGGVALICKSSLNPSAISFKNYLSFELLVVNCTSINLTIAVIYRPPHLSTATFLNDFGEFITHLFELKNEILILGDFNIHLNKPSTVSSKFLSLLDIFSLNQFVKYPTISHGNILDLIISSLHVSSIEISDLTSNISDHFLLDSLLKLNLNLLLLKIA